MQVDIQFFQHCFFYFLKINLFMYLFLAVLGLRCLARPFFSRFFFFFSQTGERGLLFVVVHGRLIVVASLFAEHGL